jgi:hypothetical protein
LAPGPTTRRSWRPSIRSSIRPRIILSGPSLSRSPRRRA